MYPLKTNSCKKSVPTHAIKDTSMKFTQPTPHMSGLPQNMRDFREFFQNIRLRRHVSAGYTMGSAFHAFHLV